MNKLVSVIVPVFNNEDFLSECISSLLRQTYTNIEIILFDDGSKDNSLRICKDFSEKDGRIKVFSRENKGVSQTRLDAFLMSKGELITFVDADDFVNEDYISLMVEHMERENADVVSSQHNNIEENKSRKVERNVYGLFDKERIKELLKTKYLYDKSSGKTGITVYLCTKLIKREFAEETLKAGLGLWYGEDQVGVTSLLLRINSLYVSRDYSYNYVIHTGQVTKKIDSSIWQAQTDCWQRIIDLDKECLLKEQLPLRMMLNINGVLGRMFKACSSFKEFSSQMKLLRESPVMSILFKKKSIDLKYNLKILFYLMKFRLYLAEYIFLKITK